MPTKTKYSKEQLDTIAGYYVDHFGSNAFLWESPEEVYDMLDQIFEIHEDYITASTQCSGSADLKVVIEWFEGLEEAEQKKVLEGE